jgi:hypothetical protein
MPQWRVIHRDATVYRTDLTDLQPVLYFKKLFERDVVFEETVYRFGIGCEAAWISVLPYFIGEKMRFKPSVYLAVMMHFFLIGSVAWSQNIEANPAIQAELEKAKTLISSWTADPVIVKEVQQQNQKGPIAGLDNEKWKTISPSDPMVKGFLDNPAGHFLKSKIEAKGSMFSRAFLSGSNGEKVAFTEKTKYYLHKGMGKFEVPFRNGTTWQGKPEFDEPSQLFGIQISAPVLSDGKPIGVLVVEISLSGLEKAAQK